MGRVTRIGKLNREEEIERHTGRFSITKTVQQETKDSCTHAGGKGEGRRERRGT